MFIQKKRIVAEEEVEAEGINIAPEATELLFEAEDVAELVAEVSGSPVDVSVDEDSIVFTVGEDEYTVSAEGDEEVLESCRRKIKGKKEIESSTRIVGRGKRTVKAPVSSSTRVIRKMPTTRRK